MTKSSPCRFSIVIPVYNCAATMAGCLNAIRELDHPSYEVIVVDDGSNDETAHICRSYPGVNVIQVTNGGPSRARNIGVEHAAGEIVAFTDGDCLVDRAWLKELEKGFETPEVAGTGGDQLSPDDETPFGRAVQDIFKALGIVTYYIQTGRKPAPTEHNPSCNAAYLRQVLDEVGGFDETLWPGEDVDLDMKIRRKGYRLMFNPKAIVRHYRPETYSGFSLMMRRYGASAWHLFLRYGLFRTLHYEPFFAILAVTLLTAVIVWRPLAAGLLLIPWPGLFIWFFSRTGDARMGLRSVVLFVLILFNWNLGFFSGWRYRPWGRTGDKDEGRPR